MADTPVSRGFVDGLLGVSSVTGAVAKIEAGYKLTSSAALFGYGQWTPQESSAGVGFKVEF